MLTAIQLATSAAASSLQKAPLTNKTESIVALCQLIVDECGDEQANHECCRENGVLEEAEVKVSLQAAMHG